jgi:RNA polymerase sigma-70 factor (ECF subfamily)
MPARSTDAVIDQGIAEARIAWPGAVLDRSTFMRHLAERAPDGRVTTDFVARVHVADLWLACACLHGDARAIAWFDERFLRGIDAYLKRIDRSPDLADEVRQVLRVRLLVGREGRAPALASYSGRGALGAWLRMASVRAMHDLIRARKPDAPLDADGEVALAATRDPALSMMKRRYAREFREAIQDALGALPAKDRNLLRLHFVDGMTTDAIAPLYSVDGSTVRRWIAALRRGLLASVRKSLSRKLGLETDDIESLMAIVRSRLELSLSRYLQSK